MVLKLQHGGTPEELVKTENIEFCSQNLGFRRSGVGSENLYSCMFPHDADMADSRDHL